VEKKEKLFSPIPYVPKIYEVRSLMDQIDKKYITVGRTLSNLVDAKNKKNNVTVEDKGYLKQQRDFTWETWRSSNLIYSMLVQRNINEILLYRPDSTSIYLKTIDGQQRMTSMWKIINNVLPLNMKKASFNSFVVGGKKYPKEFLHNKYFKDLPEEWQDLILSYNVRAIIYNNCSDEQARQIYVDIATGTKPLRSIETRKALINDEIADLIDDFLNGSWTLHTMTSSAALGNRGLDIVSQFLALVKTDGNVQLSKDDINHVLFDMRDFGITDEFKTSIMDTQKYLDAVFDKWTEIKKEADKNKTTTKGRKVSNYNTLRFKFASNKTTTIMLIWATYQAMKKQIDIDKFQSWAIKFFENPNEKYRKGLADGKSKAGDLNNVQLRVEAINDELEKLK
jgi:hypothetical protein